MSSKVTQNNKIILSQQVGVVVSKFGMNYREKKAFKGMGIEKILDKNHYVIT